MSDEPDNDPQDPVLAFGAPPEGAWTADLPELPAPRPAETPAAGPPPSPLRILEALLFVGGAPLTVERALRIVRGLTAEQFTEALDTLNRDYRRQNRPYTILPVGNGHALTLRPRFLPLQEKVFGGVREARLSTAAVDVLALVAYRQPVTREEVDSLRGGDSGALLKQLVRRGLVQVVYRGEAEHKEVMYGTTPRFLELFGLQSLDDLPKTHDLGPS